MAELVTGDFQDALDRFIADYGLLPWSPGVRVDCCLALAEWSIFLGHIDPASAFRGTYDSDDGFRVIIANAGGVVPLVAACLPPTAQKASHLRRGDIGVVGSAASVHRQFGAIFDGRGWLVRQKQGFGRMSARTLAAWTIPPK